MAIWTKPMQLKENGNWKMVEYSDEDSNLFRELCDCEHGHLSAEQAKFCIKPPTADDVVREFSKDEIIKALFEMECEKLDLNPEGLLLCFQLEFVKVSKEREHKKHGRKSKKGI